MLPRLALTLCALGVLDSERLWANPPVAAFIYPAGGQRGTKVPVRVGGLYLHQKCGFELDGRGLKVTPELRRAPAPWFEGPLLPLPESQQAEDYPVEMVGEVVVDSAAPLQSARGRVWTSQGAAGGLVFVVGDLPEVVEKEIDGDPIPVAVTLPVTANGRIFPREDVDLWAFRATKGQSVTALAATAGIRSPLVAKLEILDGAGRVLAENTARAAAGADASVRFVAPADGLYQVRISDARTLGGPAYVYRLTITVGPVIDQVFPLGGRRGFTSTFHLDGQVVPKDLVSIAIPADASAAYRHDLKLESHSAALRLDVDDFPEYVEPLKMSEPVSLPAVLNGRIDHPGASGVWRVSLTKGRPVELDLRARTLGSPLCGVVTISDATGKEVARADSPNDLSKDPTLRFTPPTDGVYAVRVAERFHDRGGPAFAYRLRISESATAPDFALKGPSDIITVPRNGTFKVKVSVERKGGFAGPLELTVTGLPDGVAAAKTTVAAGQNAAEMVLAATATAPVRPAHIGIAGTAVIGKETIRRPVLFPETVGDPGVESAFLIVTVPTPFKIDGEYTMSSAPRGQTYRRKYKLVRDNFNGSVEVRLADRQARHLQGVTGPTIVVPAGQNEFEYTAFLPPWLELGRTCRICVMATGMVKDADGTEHVVSFSSTEQNHQMIAVAEPGKLDIDLASAVVSAKVGETVRVPFRVTRAVDLRGDAKVELVTPAHWSGVSAVPVVLSNGAERGELLIAVRKDARGPFTAPAIVRVTVIWQGDPVVAEQKLELLGVEP
ncbi:PPC domain-containing protein [Fimbriiglobus ruber]|uniref:Putative serine proteinase, subtilase family n=1 Tax=Fimbriiglobus ruber TaxID=1908690 RepID=A0A225DFE7_9BACT|nr:PPC domain-containing protein [Fimbriiglobus ruber]OWK39703.1 putative serine proteinase, subtilase family [Fimbriiglobus ruber]